MLCTAFVFPVHFFAPIETSIFCLMSCLCQFAHSINVFGHNNWFLTIFTTFFLERTAATIKFNLPAFQVVKDFLIIRIENREKSSHENVRYILRQYFQATVNQKKLCSNTKRSKASLWSKKSNFHFKTARWHLKHSVFLTLFFFFSNN